MRLLLVRQDKLGDCILSTAIPPAIASAIPGAEVLVACRPEFMFLFEGLAGVAQVLPTPYRLGPAGILRTASQWRKLGLDAVLLPKEDSGDHSLAAALARVPKRIGLGRKWHARTLTSSHSGRHDEALHEVRLMLAMAQEAVGAVLPELPLTFPAENVASQTEGLGPYFVVNPSTGGTSEPWPLESFALAGQRICEASGLTAITTGPSGDERAASLAFPGSLSMAGELTLPQLGGLVQGAQFLLTVNTGAVHIAAGTGTPVCVIETRDDFAMAAARWSPWKVRHESVLPLAGIPGPAEVAAAALRLIEKSE